MRALIALCDLNLRYERVRLDVYSPLAQQVLVANLLRAGYVEECVGVTIQIE